MNKLFLVTILLALAAFNVEALRKNKLSESSQVTAVDPPPFGDDETALVEGETSSFELKNFYEYYFYCQAYELYNEYALNTGLSSGSAKRQYWYGKKYDARSIANFCTLIGNQINSSYLKTYLCSYISNTYNWFNTCSA